MRALVVLLKLEEVYASAVAIALGTIESGLVCLRLDRPCALR